MNKSLNYHKFAFLKNTSIFTLSSFPGIQTQTYRSLGVVLFKKSPAGEGVAEANGGQG